MVGFGCWEAGGTAWGPNESEDSVIEAILAGLDAGIDWVDTAEVYGDGVSETIVGRALAGRRDAVTVATKVGPSPEGTGFRPEEVRKACEQSLARLNTDRIDIYQLHWLDETGVPLEETWGAMSELVDAGLVRHIGVSNFEQKQIEVCDRDPPRGLVAAVVLDAGPREPGPHPLVRRAGRRRGRLRTARVRAAHGRGRRLHHLHLGRLAEHRNGSVRTRTTGEGAGVRGRAAADRGRARDRRSPSSRSRGSCTSRASPRRSWGAATAPTCDRTWRRPTSCCRRTRSS